DAVFCITASNGLWALGSGLWALGSGLQARPAKTAIAAVSLQDVAGDGEVLIGAEAGCVRRHRGRDEVEQILGPLYGALRGFCSRCKRRYSGRRARRACEERSGAWGPRERRA